MGPRPSSAAPVELRAMDPDGSIEPGTAPGLVPPFDLLPTAAFWIDGDDLRGGEPCVN